MDDLTLDPLASNNQKVIDSEDLKSSLEMLVMSQDCPDNLEEIDGLEHIKGNSYRYGGFLTCNENRFTIWKFWRRELLRSAKRDEDLKKMGVTITSIHLSRDEGYLGAEADITFEFTLEEGFEINL